MALRESHFSFTKQERSGIFYLLLIIVSLQISFWAYTHHSVTGEENLEVDIKIQSEIEVLKAQHKEQDVVTIYPFNPNFISDYKGYTLGMSVQEIDRLHQFREEGKYINSKEEFQDVTGVPDSLLNTISPYFKFLDWKSKSQERGFNRSAFPKKEKVIKPMQLSDLNSVSALELQQIGGVGPTLSERIVKFRDRLGGFLLDDQLNDVYGLQPEVVQRILQRYTVLNPSQIEKIDLATATASELSQIVYIKWSVAQEIVAYRQRNGGIASFDELLQVENFPADRIARIPLYLSLKK